MINLITGLYLSAGIEDIFGNVNAPEGTPDVLNAQTGLVRLLNVGLNMVMIVAGLFVLMNLIIAGYKYIFSNGDPKLVSEANLRITYTIIGLGIVVTAPLIAAVIGIVVFGRWDAIMNPQITDITDISP